MSTEISVMEKFGKNLRGLRKSFGETQLELAFAIGVGDSTISQYESGKQMPERDTLIKIAKHYHITEDGLLYGDYEHMPNMTKIPLGDAEYSRAMLSKVFPIICTPKALENADFKLAYEIHMRFLDSLATDEDFGEDSIKLCIEHYKNAGNSGLVEGIANHLWWMVFQGLIINAATPRLLEQMELTGGKTPTFKELISCLLPSFDEEDSESEYDTSVERLKFLKENEVDILANIVVLRMFEEYADLGDYYLALCYFLGLRSNSLSKEMNGTFGIELLSTFAVMGNKYCEAFISK